MPPSLPILVPLLSSRSSKHSGNSDADSPQPATPPVRLNFRKGASGIMHGGGSTVSSHDMAEPEVTSGLVDPGSLTRQKSRKSSNMSTPLQDVSASHVSQMSLRERGGEQLHKTFGLPESEPLVDDYLCALRKRILLQGRVYVFEHHVAFYANIFGYVKTKCIPFTDITAIKKLKNYGFPNSIEIVWRGGKREFFTSFLSRDDAYELLIYLWHQDSPYAKLFTGELPKQRLPKAIHKNPDRILSSKASVASAPPDLMPTLSSLPSIISTTNPVANTLGDRLPSTPQQYTSTPGLYHAASGPVELQSAPRSLSLGRRRGSRSGGGGGSAANGGAVLTHVPEDADTCSSPSCESPPPEPSPNETPTAAQAPPLYASPAESGTHDEQHNAQGDSNSRVGDSSMLAADGGSVLEGKLVQGVGEDEGRSVPPPLIQYPVMAPDEETGSVQGSAHDTEDDDGNDSPTFSTCGDVAECLHRPPPPPPADMVPVLTTDIPVSVRDFVSLFLSNESQFYARFHVAGGDKEVHLSAWRRHAVMGLVRDLNFIANLRGKSALGPAEALCNQTQRYCVYEDEHLVFETNQRMPEIPYGESFAVQLRWDVTQAPDQPAGHSRLSIAVRIPFNRQVIWRKAIEKSVRDQTNTSMKQLVEMMHAHLQSIGKEEQGGGGEAMDGAATGHTEGKGAAAGDINDGAVSAFDDRKGAELLPVSALNTEELAQLVSRLPDQYKEDVARMLDVSMDLVNAQQQGPLSSSRTSSRILMMGADSGAPRMLVQLLGVRVATLIQGVVQGVTQGVTQGVAPKLHAAWVETRVGLTHAASVVGVGLVRCTQEHWRVVVLVLGLLVVMLQVMLLAAVHRTHAHCAQQTARIHTLLHAMQQ